jgi:hypothetical protein
MRQSGARGQRQPDAASNDRQHNERESFGRPAEETNSTPLKAKRKTPRRWTWQHADDPPPYNCPQTHRAGDATAAPPAKAGGCAVTGRLIGNSKDIVRIKCGHTRIKSGNESSALRTRCNRGADICGFNADTDCPRTRTWTGCGRGCGHGLDKAPDRTRTGRGADIGAAICPDRLRFLRVHCADAKTSFGRGVRRAPSKTAR